MNPVKPETVYWIVRQKSICIILAPDQNIFKLQFYKSAHSGL